MIARLLKYDLKKITKILIYMWVITLAFAGLTAIFKIWDNIAIINIISLVLAGCAYAGIVNVLVNTFVHILRNVISNFYKDESYLTHTLPVSKKQLLISKYIASLIVVVISVLVGVLSLFLALYSPENMDIFKAFLNGTIAGFDMKASTFILLIAGVLLTQTTMLTSLSFFAVIKGNSYNDKRLLKGLIWFFVSYLAQAIVMLIVAIITFAISGNLSDLFAETPTQFVLISTLIIALIMNVINSVSFFILSKVSFEKGVNVD